MKPLLLSASLLIVLTSTAQWSTDPAAPMVVTNVANAPRYMAAIADADSGYYVFWSDLRNDPAKGDLYGQHFDSEGNALWTAGGELMLSNPTKSINQVAPLLMPDGSVIVAYMTRTDILGGDTVRAMRFDADASALWAEPSVLLTGLDYRSMKMVVSDSCAYMVAYCESCSGGGYGCKLQRVRMDGTVQFAASGQTSGSNLYGPYTIRPDGAGGLLFSIRCGNGAGTCLKAQRFDSLGTAVWPGYVDLADAEGLNYGFATSMDDTGTQTAVWEVNGDLRMRRIDTLSTSLWSPSVLAACDLSTFVQQDPATVSIGNELFVAWEDNRPPAANSDLYIQKYDLSTGAELWASDGIPAIQTNTYIPTTGLVASDSGAVIATFDGNVDGYSAMRVRNDGTLAWPEPVVFCVPSFNPFYEKRKHLPDGNGGVVAFWEGSFGGIYGARVYRNGLLYNDVGIAEATNARLVSSYPNPAHDRVTLNLPTNEQLVNVELIDMLGRSTIVEGHGNEISIAAVSSGSYIARLRTGSAVFIARIIKN